jgi:hypothetical protein
MQALLDLQESNQTLTGAMSKISEAEHPNQWGQLVEQMRLLSERQGHMARQVESRGRPADSSRAGPRPTAVHLPFAVAIIEVCD